MGEVHYMISEAAKRIGVETHVLRYWEDELSITIGRTEMGHRYYTEDNLQLFRCIKELKEQGIPLKDLKELIPDMILTRDKMKQQKEEEAKADTINEAVSETASNMFPQDIVALFHDALLENNKILEDTVSNAISTKVIKELDYLMQAQDRQEEERYKKLDSLIRQQQTMRKEYAHTTPIHRLRRLFEV